MSRINLSGNITMSIIKMVEGNPGAITAIMDLVEKHDSIDPQSFFGPLGVLIALDTFEIYGTDIYILYNDKCQKDARKTIMLLRAVQLGLLPVAKLKEMARDQMRKINLTEEEFESLDKQVCEQLEDFAKPEKVG